MTSSTINSWCLSKLLWGIKGIKTLREAELDFSDCKIADLEVDRVSKYLQTVHYPVVLGLAGCGIERKTIQKLAQLSKKWVNLNRTVFVKLQKYYSITQ